MEKAVGVNPVGTSRLDTSECSEELGGWRRTHNNSRKGIFLSNPSGNSFKKINNIGKLSNGETEIVMERKTPNKKDQGAEIGCARNADTAQRASGIVPKIDQTVGPMHAESKLNKRRKKLGSTSQTNTSSHIPDVVYLDTPGESSSARSNRLQSQRICDNLNDVIEVDELSPEIRHPATQTVGCPNDDSEDAKARQLEADEMLARDLQEQLYREMPVGEEVINSFLSCACPCLISNY